MARKKPPVAFLVCPDSTLPAALITRDKKKINRTIDMGYRKVQDIEDRIRMFMKEDA